MEIQVQQRTSIRSEIVCFVETKDGEEIENSSKAIMQHMSLLGQYYNSGMNDPNFVNTLMQVSLDLRKSCRLTWN